MSSSDWSWVQNGPALRPAFGWLVLLTLIAGCNGSRRSEEQPVASPASAVPAARRSERSPLPPAPFMDVTEQSGVRFSFESGREAGEYAILESLGGGVAAFDFDRDGDVDLMFAGGGSLQGQTIKPNKCGLFLNQGDLRFDNITDRARGEADRFYSHGAFPGDFDNDGFLDLAVSGYGGIQFFQNQGDGTLAEIAAWSTDLDTSWSTSLAWGDFNGDGNLDLFVPHYVDWSWANHPRCFAGSRKIREVCAPGDFRGLDDSLYLNDGEGRFERVAWPGLVAGGKGLGAISADIDLDGDTDLYVANDTTDNFLYLNQNNSGFEESALLAGVSGDDVGVSTGSMGVAIEDADNDGLPELWVTNFERELFALYRNEGEATFNHVSRAAGLAALGELYVGFGTVFVDFDHDGDRDIAVANGHVSYHSKYSGYKQEAILMENLGDLSFRRADAPGYFESRHTGRGLIRTDLNDDGGWDLVFSHTEEPAAILRGRKPENDLRWALVRLVGTRSNRDGVGASAVLKNDGHSCLYMRNGGGSYLSHSDERILLVANESVDDVEVTWPSGLRESFSFPTSGSQAVWIEGSQGASP